MLPGLLEAPAEEWLLRWAEVCVGVFVFVGVFMRLSIESERE